MNHPGQDPFDQYEAPGLGGPARLDLHVKAGDVFPLTLEFDALPNPIESRVTVFHAADPATAVKQYTVAAGIVADYAAKTLTLTIPAADALAWEDLDEQLAWGWAVRVPGGDPETLVNGLVHVSTRSVTWL